MKSKLTPTIFARFVVAVLLYLPLISPAQSFPKYPRGYFRWPLNLAPQIVANMGELRDNHWHMGLDIRTDQKVNQLVYAAAEGYISHLGIRPSGFGRFIMITHPNGLTTLYAHLNDFNPELEAYVRAQEDEKESWAVELDLPKDKFPVSKGSFIAYSGTTGSSQGPHVHFEIRDTKTGECLNPLLFGMPLKDDVAPSMVKLALYDRSTSVFEKSPKFFALKKSPDGYIIPKLPVLKTGLQKISFGLQAFDRINGSNNQDGIYLAKLFFDDQLQVEFIIDSIDYNETRYMNAHIDFTYKANGGAFVQHLSRLPGDKGGAYHPAKSDGVLLLEDTSTHDVRIEISDSYKNTSELNFRIKYDEGLATTTSSSPSSFPVFAPDQANEFVRPDFEASLPAIALYDTVKPYYFKNPSFDTYSVSASHQLNTESIPVQGTFTVRLKADKKIPGDWEDKLVIRRNGGGARVARLQRDWISADFGDFGVFQAYADVVPPSVNSIGSADTVNLSPASRIVFTPTDKNFGIKSFRAELDNQWLRFTNDKSRSWIYVFDEKCPYGVHQLKVTVEDLVGNITTKTWWFKKYPYTAPPKKKATKRKGSTKRKVVTKRKKR